MASPVFVITNNGNAAVNATILGGLRVEIASFRVGSDYSTPATSLDTGLVGTTFFSGTPISYSYIDNDAVGIRLELPASVGPFEFGEIGLFMPDGTMFARASFGSPQQKYSAGLTGLPNIWRFTAVLKFTQAPALFNINTSCQNRILEVGHFGLSSSPSTMIGSPNAIIVQETTPTGDSVFMWAASPTRWAFSKYTQVGYITLDAASTATDLPSSDWSAYFSATPGTYLVQTLSGDVRMISSVAAANAVMTQPLGSLPANSVLEVYRVNEDSGQITNTHYNELVSLFNQQWGLPTGANEVNAKGWNQTPIPLLGAGVNATPADWIGFISAVQQAVNLLGAPNSIPLTGLNSDWSASYYSSLMKYQALVQSINSVVSAPTGAGRKTEVQLHNTATHSGVWSSLNYDISVSFVSPDAMRGFFNAGGWIGFDTQVTPDNYVQMTQRVELEQLDTIRMKAATTESTGLKRFVMEYGDGLITDLGNAGLYGLTGTSRRIWAYAFVSGSGTGATQPNGTIEFAVEAYQSSASSVALSFSVLDSSDPAYINDTEGGSPQFVIQAVTGRPDPAVIFSPSFVHPTVTVLGTTVW